MRNRIVLPLLLALLMTACSSSNHTTTSSSSGAISGNWQMSLQKANSTLAPKTQSGFLMQSGDAITGSVIFIDIPCSGVGGVTGTLDGSAVSLVVAPSGTQVNLTGTVNTGGGSMGGNYTILSTGCVGSQTAPQSGTWTANLVAPLSGSIQGSLSSTVLGTTFALTGQVTQGSNTGLSSATLGGTLSPTGYCFATSTIVGSISGTSVVMNLVNSEGAQLGQIIGTSSLDGTTMTGTYQVMGQGKGAAPGCVDGDSGTVTMSL
jgi:hypothetical protein